MAAAPIDSVPSTAEVLKVAETQNQLRGFQGWKQKRVSEARMNLEIFKKPTPMEEASEEVMAENVENSQDKSEVSAVEKALPDPTENQQNQEAEKLRQLEFNLEIAQGLTIHDYFALYLKNKSQQEMAAAIQELSASELSELLMAYRKSLYGVPVAEKATEKKIH